eukprot:scaffold18176_cov60-Phaeocystis_antarctica.AAC.3
MPGAGKGAARSAAANPSHINDQRAGHIHLPPCPEAVSDGAPGQRANAEHALSGPVPQHLQRHRF